MVVREFVKNLPPKVSRGYYYGSDQYIWGREFLQRDAEGTRQLEINKHWYQWLLWGRFAYDPELSNDRLQAIVGDRFELDADQVEQLFDAWQHASMVYPTTTGFHWGTLDFQWYIEGCQSRPGPAENETGFHDVNRFISLKPHAESNCVSIPDFLKAPDEMSFVGKRTPLQVADELDQHASRAIEILNAMPAPDNSELKLTIHDIRTIAQLGHYYADKIRGATELARFRRTSNKNDQEKSIRHLANAALHWHKFATLALAQHRNPLWTNRVGYVDWKENYQLALLDVKIAGGDPGALGLPPEVSAVNVRPHRQARKE